MKNSSILGFQDTDTLRITAINGRRMILSYKQLKGNVRSPKMHIYIFSIAFILFLMDYLHLNKVLTPAFRLYFWFAAIFIYFVSNVALNRVGLYFCRKYPNLSIYSPLITFPSVFLLTLFIWFGVPAVIEVDYEWQKGFWEKSEWQKSFWEMMFLHFAGSLIFESFYYAFVFPSNAPEMKLVKVDQNKVAITLAGVKIILKDISHIKSVDHYLEVTTSFETITVLGSLKNVIQDLPKDLGSQVNRSTWVSYRYIEKNVNINGKTRVIMKNGSSFHLSKTFDV